MNVCRLYVTSVSMKRQVNKDIVTSYVITVFLSDASVGKLLLQQLLVFRSPHHSSAACHSRHAQLATLIVATRKGLNRGRSMTSALQSLASISRHTLKVRRTSLSVTTRNVNLNTVVVFHCNL